MEREGCTIQAPPLSPRRSPPVWSDSLLRWVDRQRRVLFAGLALIYLAGFNGQWRMEEPDSALYLTLARNIATGHGYTYHGKANAAAYPGLPYLLSLIYRLSPSSHRDPLNLVGENLLMPLMAAATLGLTYRLMRLNAGRPTAVLVTLTVGLTRTFYRAAFALMTDMPFAMGVMAFLAGYEGWMQRERRGKEEKIGAQRWIDVMLMLLGGVTTIVMRPTWISLAPVTAIGLIIAGVRRKISWKVAAAGLGLTLAAAAVFYVADPRRGAGKFRSDRYEDQVIQQFASAGPGQLAAAAEFRGWDLLRQTAVSALLGIKFGPAPDAPGVRHWYDILGAAVDVAGATATLVLGIALLRRRAVWGLCILATLAMMVLVQEHERYFLPILPLLIFAWWRGLRWVSLRLAKWGADSWAAGIGNIFLGLALAMGIMPNALHVCGIIIEQRRVPFFTRYREGKCLPLIAAAKRLEQALPDTLVLAPDKTGRFLTYLSGRDVFESNEAPEMEWPQKGRRVYILDDPNDSAFQQWIRDLGIKGSLAFSDGHNAEMGRLWLRRVPKGMLP